MEGEKAGGMSAFLVLNTKANKSWPSYCFVVCRPQILQSWGGELAAERGVLWISEDVSP